jgi:hypothetical protein
MVKKVNRRTRSVLPPCGSAPPRLCHNQWSNLWHGGPGPHFMYLARRFLCAEKANRRVKSTPLPAIVRLFAPPKPIAQSLARGPGPTSHPPWAPVPEYREVEPPLAPVPRILGATAEDGEVEFSKPMQRLEAPRAWPNKAIKCGGHGSVSRGDRRGSRSDQGRTGSNCTSGRAEAANQSPNKLGPTCRLVSAAEAGPGATVGTLNQGYPLLQH